MPCSSCKARGHSCRMISSNSRCSECVRRGRKCDATSVPITNLGRLNQEKKKLELQESEVEYSFNVVGLFCVDFDCFLCAGAVWCRLQ
ncbi:hypothetical protein MGG_16047 [Pyricularia oryzae 70-15]|uniref:Zn(2)-C6 fungal-type domain-containing protein n=1 Tax=Pyricularia oryzae (strain 70-15 / ATCC MYA-4617 / FGSC 8958) TaxID=242507 RepID=G4MP71_PYRO7|nr:uncharacterized protein MGG_16047 [Pyricularia oryzae 70-15]EHA56330.1 hypothetical protein MGG_16047 [Pyricularia oryzae 70-15]